MRKISEVSEKILRLILCGMKIGIPTSTRNREGAIKKLPGVRGMCVRHLVPRDARFLLCMPRRSDDFRFQRVARASLPQVHSPQ